MEGSTVCLSDLCELVADSVDPSTRPADLYLGLEHLTSGRLVPTGVGQASDVRSSKSSFQPGDVLYGKLRPYLDKAVLADEEGICTTELLVLRAKSGVEPRFLAAVVHSPAFVQHAIAGTKGVQHPRTSWAHIREFSMPEFTTDERRRIADLLWVVHDAVMACEALIESGENIKRATMRSLFTCGLRGEAQKETEIGPVPASWEIVSVGTVRNRLQYGTSARCSYEPTEFPVLRIPNVEPGRVNDADLKFGRLRAAEADRYRLKKGDLIFIRTNGVVERLGTCAIYTGIPENALFASYLIRASLKLDQVDPHFMAYFFGSELGTSVIAGRATPAADGKYNLNTGTIDALPLPLPPTLKEQREIVAVLDAIDRKIDLHRRKRTVLDDLFKVLLHKLMTGEIRVAELDLAGFKERCSDLSPFVQRYEGVISA